MSAAHVPVTAAHGATSSGGKRVLPLVFGGIVLLIALALLTGGGATIWALTQRDGDGYIASSAHRLATSSYALVSEKLDVGTDAPDWAFGDHLGRIGIEATSSRPVFLGIAPTAAVDRYLARVQHDRVTDFELDPFSVGYQRSGVGTPSTPPSAQRFWRAQASGAGTQTISWPLEAGDWSVVAMNADGSRGVSVDTRVAARLPFLGWAAVGLLAGGLVALLVGAGLVYLGARSPRAARGDG